MSEQANPVKDTDRENEILIKSIKEQWGTDSFRIFILGQETERSRQREMQKEKRNAQINAAVVCSLLTASGVTALLYYLWIWMPFWIDIFNRIGGFIYVV